MNIAQIDSEIATLEVQVSQRIWDNDKLVESIAFKRARLEDLEVTQKALNELRAVSERIQVHVYQSIENLATYCLQSVFGQEYCCEIDTSVSRGKVNVVISVMKGNLRLDPLSACGGGVADVLALALRIGVILADTTNRPRQVLICDEPCRFVSEGYRKQVAELLEYLADAYGFQIIMVTHDEAFKIGKIVEID